MHPELLQLLLVSGSVAQELLAEDSKSGPKALEGACVLVCFQDQHQHQKRQQAVSQPRLHLVCIRKVLKSGASCQLEVVGGGPELQASAAHGVHQQLQAPSTSNGNAISAFAPAASSISSISSAAASTVDLDQVVSIGFHQLPAGQAATLCTFLAARLALRGSLPDELKVYNKACQLRMALMHALARKQGRQPSRTEAQALVEWQKGTQVGGWQQLWSCILE